MATWTDGDEGKGHDLPVHTPQLWPELLAPLHLAPPGHRARPSPETDHAARQGAGPAGSPPTYQGVSVVEHDLACRPAPRIGHVGIGMVDGQGTQTWGTANRT